MKPSASSFNGAVVTHTLPSANVMELRQGPPWVGRSRVTWTVCSGPFCSASRTTVPFGESYRHRTPFTHTFSVLVGGPSNVQSLLASEDGSTQTVIPLCPSTRTHT